MQGLRIAPPEAPVTGYMFGKVRVAEPRKASLARPSVPSGERALVPSGPYCMRHGMRVVRGADSPRALMLAGSLLCGHVVRMPTPFERE